MPDRVKIWTGHDYPPEERKTPQSWMSVRDHKAKNKYLMEGISEAEFLRSRTERDANMAEPRLLHQSLQVNIRAGKLPTSSTGSGYRMLHLPLKLGGVEW